MIIANYAEMLIAKFKRFATLGSKNYNSERSNDFEQY